MQPQRFFLFGLMTALLAAAPCPGQTPDKNAPPAWAAAAQKGPMTADETRDFMKRLAQYVFDKHLKKDEKSQQRGMVYEYVNTKRLGEFDQAIQGEALDTMHDGAWLAAALVNACRATGDPFYREFLAKWQAPFYCLMLNHSDTLFSAKRNDARPGGNLFGKEHALIEGEKGFVPYWWDDGASVSLERTLDKNPLAAFACVDNLAGKPNPKFLLDGYSLGCSNHLAQDLGVMVQQTWLLFREGSGDADKRLAADLAEAAKNLYESRLRHHGPIPMCVAPAALVAGDAKRLAGAAADGSDWRLDNHYTRALYEFLPGKKYPLPQFADDQQYHYYCALARFGSALPPGVAFRTIYDAYTEAMPWRYFCDVDEVPPGINRGEFGMDFRDGALDYYQSDARGVRFLGSRMGPQSMILSAIALQLLKARPGLWEERYKQKFSCDLRVIILDPAPGTKPEKLKQEPETYDALKLNLVGLRQGLMLCGATSAEEVTIRLFSRPDAKGTHAILTLKKGESAKAVNDKGEPLLLKADLKSGPDGMAFDLLLPYTVTKGQKPWANGIEHGRYSIQVGETVRNFYLASHEAQVKAHLEREVGQGLRIWDAIFRQYGYIPTHLGRNAFWDGLSDSGGYAHLLSAGAEWLLYLDGKNDWDVHHVPEM
ncbi:MAG: hypothetical protein NT049_13165 [Planctomycetota bacterium]|nr:hypothetical protein [Planctomycetota bacterium]